MEIKGFITKGKNDPISGVNVTLIKNIYDPRRYKTATDDSGNFKITVPDSDMLKVEDGKIMYMILSHPDFQPLETFISSTDASKTVIDLGSILLREYKFFIFSRKTTAILNLLLLFLISLFFMWLYIYTPLASPGYSLIEKYNNSLAEERNKIKETMSSVKADAKKSDSLKSIDSILNDIEKNTSVLDINFTAFRESREKYNKEIDNYLKTVPETRDVILKIRRDMDLFLLTIEDSFHVKSIQQLSILNKTHPYWWHVVFWSIFGAVTGIVWTLVQTFILGNYDSKHFFSSFYRIIFAPFYAVIFIFLIQIFGLTAGELAETPIEIKPGTEQYRTEFVIVFSFLIGLFIERFHEMFRRIADSISKSKFAGGKAPSK